MKNIILLKTITSTVLKIFALILAFLFLTELAYRIFVKETSCIDKKELAISEFQIPAKYFLFDVNSVNQKMKSKIKEFEEKYKYNIY